MGDNGRQDHFRAQEADHTNQHPTPHMKGDNRRQWETTGDKTTSEPKKPTTPTNTKAARSKVALRTPTVNCLGKNGARHVDLWHDVSQTFSCLHEIHPNDLCQIIRPHQTSQGILPKTPPANSALPTPGGRKSGSN